MSYSEDAMTIAKTQQGLAGRQASEIEMLLSELESSALSLRNRLYELVNRVEPAPTEAQACSNSGPSSIMGRLREINRLLANSNGTMTQIEQII